MQIIVTKTCALTLFHYWPLHLDFEHRYSFLSVLILFLEPRELEEMAESWSLIKKFGMI